MGTHQKPGTVEVVAFIMRLGTALGYIVKEEEYMFPGANDSPILDITWRATADHKFPLFIFEIDSSANKGLIA